MPMEAPAATKVHVTPAVKPQSVRTIWHSYSTLWVKICSQGDGGGVGEPEALLHPLLYSVCLCIPQFPIADTISPDTKLHYMRTI